MSRASVLPLVALAVVVVSCSSPALTPTPEPQPTATPIPFPPTATPIPAPIPTAVVTPTPTTTPWPTATPWWINPPTPTPKPTATPRPTPTPLREPLRLDFVPIVASEEAWDCFAGRRIPWSWEREDHGGNLRLALVGDNETLCGWHLAFSEQEKRPEVTYYRTHVVPAAAEEGQAWTTQRLDALADILAEITSLTGIQFVTDDGEADFHNSLLVRLDDRATLQKYCTGSEDPMACGGYGTSRERDAPTYPLTPYVYMHGEEVGDAQLFRFILRHELLHALFGFMHSFTSMTIMDPDSYPDRVRFHERAAAGNPNPEFYDLAGETPDGFGLADRVMLQLYGDIPRGMSWEEIQRRACIEEDGACVEMYEWREGPWWEW